MMVNQGQNHLDCMNLDEVMLTHTNQVVNY